MPACTCRDVWRAAALFDRRNRDSRPQEVDPFCMASVTEDASLGYLTKDCFMLRLELRIKCPDNESATFALRQRTMFCEVSIKKAFLIVKMWVLSVEHQTCVGDESVYPEN